MRCFLMAVGLLTDCREDGFESRQDLWVMLKNCIRDANANISEDSVPELPVRCLRWVKETVEATGDISSATIGSVCCEFELAKFVEATIGLYYTNEQFELQKVELNPRKAAMDEYNSIADAYLKLGEAVVNANTRRSGEAEVWRNALYGVDDHWANRQ